MVISLVETDKEYKLRVLGNEIIDYLERLVLDDGCCDCESIQDEDTWETHQEDCTNKLIRLDVELFRKKLQEIGLKNE